MQATSRRNYEEQDYNQWSQLPPNLPLSNAISVPSLHLRFYNLIYLNQINAQDLPIQLKLEWWGMKHPHILSYDQQASCEGKYIVCCHLQRLLNYFNDMKVLAVNICNKTKLIGKVYLNFALLKGWRGEIYQMQLDVKQRNKKIGELSLDIEIKTINNPFQTQPISLNVLNLTQRSKNARLGYQQVSNVNINMSSLKQQYLVQNLAIEKKQSFNPLNTQSQPSSKSFQTEQQAHGQFERSPRNSNRYYQKNRLDSVLQQPLIGHNRQSNQAKLQTQLIRLVEDYNILFDKNPQTNIQRANSENNIEIQIVKIEINKRSEGQIEVTVPLINGGQNYYKLAVGGLIKLQFACGIAQQAFIKYLKECSLSFRGTDKVEGSIKLSKVLSKSNEIIEIQLFEKGKKQRGVCWIRAIPPPSAFPHPIPAQKIESNKQVKKARQQPQAKLEQYVLLNIKCYNPIENCNRLSNLFLKISSQQFSIQSKTLWNARTPAEFDQKITCKIIGNTLAFELFDRQHNPIKIASGQLTMKTPIGINLQVSLLAKTMNGLRVIGYISLDYFRNGLESVTKMVGVLNKAEPKRQVQKKEILREQIKQNIIDEIPDSLKQMEDVLVDEDKQNDDHEINIPQEQAKIPQIKKKPIKVEQADQNLDLLQIYNRIFTYLHSNQHTLQQLAGKDQHKITQFISILSPLTPSIISLTHLNQLITHHLFPTHLNNVNKIDTLSFRDSFDAFATYYQLLIQQKDSTLSTFLSILQEVGMSINDLEYELRKDKKIWNRINSILTSQKDTNINVVEHLRRYYEKKNDNFKYGMFQELSSAQFCDILRKYEIYETTMGSLIGQDLVSERVHRNIVELLEQLQPNIELYSYKELIQFLQLEQIILSSWQLMNLQQQLAKIGSRTIPKYPRMKQKGIEEIKPTISKSPTFGYLHQPEHFKEDFMTSDRMVDSLAIKLNNLAISPINYNSNHTIQNQIRATFSHLKYSPIDLKVNSISIPIPTTVHARSKSIQQGLQMNPSHHLQQSQQPLSSQLASYQRSHKEHQSRSQDTSSKGMNIELKLLHIDREFSYKIQLYFRQIAQGIFLQSLHNQWNAIVSEQGEYLGSILIT